MIKTSYLILFAILGIFVAVSGLAYAPAISTITLAGDVIVTDNLDVSGSISSQTITNLDSRIDTLEGGI